MTSEIIPNYNTSNSPDGYFQYVSFDSRQKELVNVAHGIHVDCYQRMGFVKPSAVENGRFAPGIDKANGPNVEYLVGHLTGSSPFDENGHRGSLRKIRIGTGGSITDLPSYPICEKSLWNDGRDILNGIENPQDNLKEIAALSGDDSISVFYMLKQAIHTGLPNKEKWFFGIVSETFDSLESNFGPNTVRQIGEPVPIPDSRVSDGIRLVPAYVDTENFIDSMRENLQTASNLKQKIKIGRSFLLCVNGLDPSLLSDETQSFIQSLSLKEDKPIENLRSLKLWSSIT